MTTVHSPSSSSPPPIAQTGPVAWVRKNLFGSWFDSLLTIAIGLLLSNTIIGFVNWSLTEARWEVIPANLPLFFVGRYPAAQYWRVWAIVYLISLLAGLTWGILGRNATKLFPLPALIVAGVVAVAALFAPEPLFYRLLLLVAIGLVLGGAWLGKTLGRSQPKLGKWLPWAWVLLPIVCFWLLIGGLILPFVPTTNWGGLMLTILMSLISIALCFPFGLLLALGRQSNLPVVRWLSTIYIEVIRGVPLLGLLFIGSVMIPLFLPANIRLDLVLRAIVILSMFSAAYLAENIRGGLQSVPKGQTEASLALGLNSPLTTALIVMPQALKVSIPAIVGQFISLLQDTTLVAILGLFELLGISRTILANPNFIGRYAEVYLFIGIIFWIMCYAMSWASRKLEEKLNTTY